MWMGGCVYDVYIIVLFFLKSGIPTKFVYLYRNETRPLHWRPRVPIIFRTKVFSSQFSDWNWEQIEIQENEFPIGTTNVLTNNTTLLR